MIPDHDVFFVLGYQRSGTTWLATLLRAHPEVHCDGEGHFHRGDDHRRYLPDCLASCGELKQWATEHSNLWCHGRDVSEDAEFFAAAITRAVFDRVATHTQKRLVGDKSGLVGPKAVASLHRMFPGARVLHLVRDPRDVAVSKCFHLWRGVADAAIELPPGEEAIRSAYLNDSQAFGANGLSIFHHDFLRAFAEEWATWVPACRELGRELFRERYFELSYEGLHGDTHEVLNAVLTFLGASVDPAIVRTCVAEASFNSQSGRSPGHLDVASYFRKGIVGDWATYFTPEDIVVLEKLAGAAMQRMGYTCRYAATGTQDTRSDL